MRVNSANMPLLSAYERKVQTVKIPSAPPTTFSKASMAVPRRSGVRVCRYSRRMALEITADEINSRWVGKGKNGPENRKRNDVFKMGVSFHVCIEGCRKPEINRIHKGNARQGRVSDKRNGSPCRESD